MTTALADPTLEALSVTRLTVMTGCNTTQVTLLTGRNDALDGIGWAICRGP